MNILGESRCFQGRFRESRELHEKVLEGMTKTLGPDSEDTLVATDNLGKIMWRYFDYQTAHDLHAKAFHGLSKVLGPTHERTLQAKESLALSYIDLPNAALDRAHQMMLEVKRERKRRLGTEQPWTLLARCSLARIKSAMGDHISAERLMRKTLPIAERNLGKYHLGTLMGNTYLAQVMYRQKRYDDAEAMLLDVLQERHRYEIAARDDGEHPDRIYAMRCLLTCYRDHGKLDEALNTCDQLHTALSTLGGEGLGLLHPIMKWLNAIRREIELLVEQKGQDPAESYREGNRVSVMDKEVHLPASDTAVSGTVALPSAEWEDDRPLLLTAGQVRSRTY